MDNLENKIISNEQLDSNNTENKTTSDVKKIHWYEIAIDLFTALIGANMVGSVVVVANECNIEDLPIPYKISVFIGGFASILMGSQITLKSGNHFWNRLETKLYGSTDENDIEKGTSYTKKR